MIIRTLTLSALGAAALVLATASPAAAHNYVVDSTPAEGDTITDLPAEWSITTNKQMLDLDGNENAFAIIVTDAQGRYYGDGCVAVDGDTLTAAAALGAAGDYTIAFQLVSADGHTLSDEFEFAYEPAAGAVAGEGSVEAPQCGASGSGDAHGDGHGDSHGEDAAHSDDDGHHDGDEAQDELDATGTSASSAADAENAAVLGTVAGVGGGLLAAAVIATIVWLVRRGRRAQG